MTHLWLAPGVFARANDDGAVLLDVRRDLYLGLDAQQAHALAWHVADWPGAHGGQDRSNDRSDPESGDRSRGEVADGHRRRTPTMPLFDGLGAFSARADAGGLLVSLLSRDLLREESASDHLWQSASLPPVGASLHTWPEMNPRDVRARDVLTFTRSLAWGLRLTRRGHLREAIERTRARRLRCTHGPMDLTKARIALGRYVHVRAFFFAKRGRCLLDSLTLIEFLAHEGLYPHLVIGVQVRPFAAHSWVQEGPFVFNGTPEYAGAYLPILTV